MIERTIIITIGDDYFEFPFEFDEEMSETEMYEVAADYVMSNINIELI